MVEFLYKIGGSEPEDIYIWDENRPCRTCEFERKHLAMY